MLKTVIASDSADTFLQQWLAASEQAEKLWQAVEGKGTNEKTKALSLGIIPNLDLAGKNLIRIVGGTGIGRATFTVKSPWQDGIIDDDILEDEFNLLAAVGLLQPNDDGHYLMAIPEFDDADFQAAVEREGQRRSDEYDGCWEEDEDHGR
jgi:hypothetical protein